MPEYSEERLRRELRARLYQLHTLRAFIDSQILKTTTLIQGLNESNELTTALASILEMPLDFAEMSVRSHNALRNMNVKTVGDLVRLQESDLLRSKNFGQKSLTELKRMLSVRGLQLGMFR